MYFFYALIAPDTEISREFPLSNYNRTVLYTRSRIYAGSAQLRTHMQSKVSKGEKFLGDKI